MGGRNCAEISVLLRVTLRRIEALDSRTSSCSGAAKVPKISCLQQNTISYAGKRTLCLQLGRPDLDVGR